MYVDGVWTGSAAEMPVIAPYSAETVDMVPVATADQVERTLAAAVEGTAEMARLTAYERSRILNRAADAVAAQCEDLARTITLEEGKPITEARAEAGRMPDLLRLCAFEGSQLRGEVLPLDAQSGAKGKLGLTMRVPCGIVLAITPFNYPLLLVVHKLGPALAAGNAVILKPSERTPLSALKLTRILLEAGLPPNGLQCINGAGPEIGPRLCADPRVRKISFTGSVKVGELIAGVAGAKRLSLELGSNSPLIILSDANLDQVAEATAAGGYVNAGQVCISAQRVMVHRKVYADFLDALKPRVEAIKVGDPLAEDTRLSAMISEPEARRVQSWIREAVSEGGRLVTGGCRDRAVMAPTVVADVKPQMRVFREELFGPAVGVMPVEGIDEAIALANDSKYGLGAGVFTRDLGAAMRFAREVQSGNIMINWTPLWRADLMPYGGLKNSGIGKEGPRYAVEEMTESKTIVFHGLEG
jgi:glyceraldehyde-3-phosphate dehydrogenase (NADP+)